MCWLSWARCRCGHSRDWSCQRVVRSLVEDHHASPLQRVARFGNPLNRIVAPCVRLAITRKYCGKLSEAQILRGFLLRQSRLEKLQHISTKVPPNFGSFGISIVEQARTAWQVPTLLTFGLALSKLQLRFYFTISAGTQKGTRITAWGVIQPLRLSVSWLFWQPSSYDACVGIQKNMRDGFWRQSLSRRIEPVEGLRR